MASTSRCASAQAVAESSRVIVCRRIPNFTSRPRSSARARTDANSAAADAGGSPHISHTSAWRAATRLPASDEPPKKIAGWGSGARETSALSTW